MIQLSIMAKGELITDSFDTKEVTLMEATSILYRLEQMKALLLEMDFSDIEIREGDD